MKLVQEAITIAQIKEIGAQKPLEAVVDVDKNLMVIDIPDYMTGELYMLEECGSRPENLWGIQLYPERYDRADWVLFDAPMNSRPSGNQTNYIQDPSIREKIKIMLAQVVRP